MRPFVRHFSAPGQQVFDPFCGFGSTLLAAALEGRQAHGMEVDPARAVVARERLRRHAVQAPVVVGGLAQVPPAAPVAERLMFSVALPCWVTAALMAPAIPSIPAITS